MYTLMETQVYGSIGGQDITSRPVTRSKSKEELQKIIMKIVQEASADEDVESIGGWDEDCSFNDIHQIEIHNKVEGMTIFDNVIYTITEPK